MLYIMLFYILKPQFLISTLNNIIICNLPTLYK